MKKFPHSILLLTLLFVPAMLRAQTSAVSASARVDSVHYLVGDPITLHIELRHPAGTSLRAAIPDTLDAFHVLAREQLLRKTDTLTTTAVVVARYDSGASPVPPLQFIASLPGDSARVVATNPVEVTVHTVAVDTTLDIRDIKPPLWIPFTLAELALYAGIALAVAVAGYVLYRWLKERRARPVAEMPPAPARPAHLIALEELQRLKERKLWQKGEVKAYYTEVTEILRRYIERRYGVPALEETSEEIMLGMRKAGVRGLDTLEPLLRRADLVKFARYQPLPDEHEQSWNAAHGFVRTTMPAPAAEGGKEAEGVGA